MKIFGSALIFALMSTYAWGQTTCEDIISDYSYINVERNEVEFPAEPMEIYGDINKLAFLLNKDIFSFYDMNDKYPTQLQKNAFMKTEEYLNMVLPSFNDVYKATFESKFFVLYNLRYNKPYDTKNRCFKFRIGIRDYDKTKKIGYIGLGNALCVSFPNERLKITKLPTNDGDNYYYQDFNTPTISEDIALRIEQEINKPTCSVCLMFIVQPRQVSREVQSINFGGYVGRQEISTDFVLAKTVGLYIVDTETDEVLVDISEILSISK